MKWLYCVDAVGFEGLLEEGKRYRVENLPARIVRVWTGTTAFLCAADRFSEEDPNQ